MHDIGWERDGWEEGSRREVTEGEVNLGFLIRMSQVYA